MTLSLALVVMAGTALAGFVQGASGFAFALVAMSVWAWTIEPQLAAPMVVWGSWVGQLLSLGAVRPGAGWRRAVPFVIGGLTGVPLGVWLLGYLDAGHFRTAIGLLLVLYCSAMLLIRHLPALRWGGRTADGAIGLIGGVMGGLGGLTGPVPTLWCSLRRWDKDAQRAVFQVFNLSMHSMTLVSYAVSGTLRLAMLPVFALMVPVAILPTLAGVRLYRRLSDESFRRLILLLLLVSGLVLLAAPLLR